MIRDILPRLSNPPSPYRGMPFWAWNAKLDPAEIRRQVRVFHKMGLGGFFMHARTGLATEYLGKEWFECVRAAVDEAQKLGMEPWMYDEDRFPSGSAGGIVTANPKYRASVIVSEHVAPSAVAEKASAADTLGWFAEKIKLADGIDDPVLMRFTKPTSTNPEPAAQIASYRRLKSATSPLRRDEILVRYFRLYAKPDSWYNWGTYVDTLSKPAIREFVKVTHEKYLAELGDKFGKVVPGCFTDEPNFERRPWTDALPREFKKRFGYDILDHLPELLSFVGDVRYSQVRHDYVEIITSLFVKSFAKTVGDWCGRHGLKFTGHVLSEDTLSTQTNNVGSAQRFYEYQQAPGIDQLTERWMTLTTAKQCSSVAHQLGRKFRLVECYGCAGWDFALEGHKAIGDWLEALGINHRCPHLAWYSMEAQAKRDYPASLSYQSPWHLKYKSVEDYFARIGEALASGTEVTPLLVVHPVESIWGYRLPGIVPEIDRLDEEFQALTTRIVSAHVDFDYGDEDHIARWGKVADGKVCIKQATYDAVLVPRMATIRSTTLAMLEKFAAKGGVVAYIGEPPACVDAKPSSAANKAYAKFTKVDDASLIDGLAKFRRISIRDGEGECGAVICRETRCEDAQVVFACNTSANLPQTVNDAFSMPFNRDRTIEYPSAILTMKADDPAAGVYELDLRTGAISAVEDVRRNGSEIEFASPFKRLQSRMFIVTAAKLPVAETADEAALPSAAFPKKGIAYRLDDDNALILDWASYSVDGKRMAASRQVLEIDNDLRARLGKPKRTGAMEQPWHAKKKAPERSLDIELRFKFGVAEMPDGKVDLVIERPDLYEITLNGVPLRSRGRGWWVDPCMRRLAIPSGALRMGDNELILKGRYDETLPGLEAMFIVGKFGVARNGRDICGLPATLDVGDVCTQGLPNYSGNVTYEFDVEVEGGFKVEVPPFRGSAVGVKVDGGAERVMPFAPYCATFAKAGKGPHRVEVTLYGHRRNVFGPFYLPGGQKWVTWHGPDEMGRIAAKKRALVPFGIGIR